MLGAIFGGLFELILHFVVNATWITGVLGSWIFSALAGLYLGGVIGAVISAFTGLLTYLWRWPAVFHAAFYSVLGAAATWIAFIRYGIIFGGALEIVDGVHIDAIVGAIAGFVAGALAESTTRVGTILSAVVTAEGDDIRRVLLPISHLIDQHHRPACSGEQGLQACQECLQLDWIANWFR